MSEFELDWPSAWGGPAVTGVLRERPEDFRVDERLGFEPGGQGEHWLVQLRKRGDNTAWAASRLAQCAGIRDRDVGYCGLKDRHAETSQWFSLYCPKGGEPDWSPLAREGLELLQVDRHPRKLRRGEHAANRFELRLRRIEPLPGKTLDQLRARLDQVGERGVPNYFGAQRFGREAGNLHSAAHWFSSDGRAPRSRRQRGLVMSAARSWLFNRVLAERVLADNWRDPLPGEPDAEPTGPLWGRGRPLSGDSAAGFEARALSGWEHWCQGLEHVGLNQDRRALVLRPRGWRWQLEGDQLWLRFELPPGTFATAVLAELALWTEPSADAVV